MMLKYIDKTRKLRSLSKRGYIALSFLFIIIISGIFINLDRLNNSYQQSLVVSEIKSENISLLKSVSDMDNGFRGYMLYKSTDFLSAYQEGSKDYDLHLNKIKEKLGKDERQTLELNKIDSRVKLWQAKTAAIISSGQIPNSWPPKEKDTTISKIKVNAAAIEKIENKKIADYEKDEKTATRWITIMAFFGSFLPLAMAFTLSRNFSLLANDITLANDSLLEEIANRKELETKLFKALALQGAVLKLAPNPIIIIDEHGEIVDFNSASEELFCIEKKEIVGKSMLDTFIPEKLKAIHKNKLSELIKNDDLINQTIKTNLQDCKGNEIPVELHVALVNLISQSYFVCFITPIKKGKKNGNN